MKKVFKYATGEEIPEGAIYLSTQVEKVVEYEYQRNNPEIAWTRENNRLVWHYFLVEVKE